MGLIFLLLLIFIMIQAERKGDNWGMAFILFPLGMTFIVFGTGIYVSLGAWVIILGLWFGKLAYELGKSSAKGEGFVSHIKKPRHTKKKRK